MLIRLDMASATPIYVQLRNQIVMGIGTGALKVGEKLPTVRQMAADAGVNTMTVNKTYQLLKAEGFIEIDRRRGAVVNPVEDTAGVFREKLEGELALLGAEAKIKGMNEQEFLQLCETIFENLSGQTGSLQFGEGEGRCMMYGIRDYDVCDGSVCESLGRGMFCAGLRNKDEV